MMRFKKLSMKAMMKQNKSYKNLQINDEKNYRDIAETMTKSGYQMNHSSVRNYVIRIMRKFVSAYVEKNNIVVPPGKLDDIAESHLFHQGIADVLHSMNKKDTYLDKGTDVKRRTEKPTKNNT